MIPTQISRTYFPHRVFSWHVFFFFLAKCNVGGDVPQPNWQPNWLYKPESLFGGVAEVHLLQSKKA